MIRQVRVMKRNRRRPMMLFLAAVFTCCMLSGCGDGITEETKKAVTDKTNQALELYADIEKTVEENQLTAEQEFIDMKTKLTQMSAQIQERVEDTTEEDGKLALEQLDKIIANLQSVKKNVEESLAKVQKEP